MAVLTVIAWIIITFSDKLWTMSCPICPMAIRAIPDWLTPAVASATICRYVSARYTMIWHRVICAEVFKSQGL